MIFLLADFFELDPSQMAVDSDNISSLSFVEDSILGIRPERN